jgi:hypothetical protein
MIIGVSGNARAGKDTFCNLYKENKDKNTKRVAFADAIKEELKNLLLTNFNINPLNCSDEEKEIIRPLLVSYGTDVARKLNKNHWIDKIKDQLILNEQDYIRSFKNSLLIHINREGFPPMNIEESKNSPILEKNSDFVFNWKTFVNNEDPHIYFNKFLNESKL